MDDFYSRKDTKIIKGIAIVLMLIHHLWAFPERIGGTLRHLIELSDTSLIIHLGFFGRICVSIFFFCGGYGIYMESKERKIDILEKLKRLYMSYWKVFFIFIPIAFAFFRNQPLYCDCQEICAKYAIFSIRDFVANLLGLSCSYNGEWWFLYSYVIATITYPLIIKILDKFSDVVNIAIVFIGIIFVAQIFPAIKQIQVLDSLNGSYIYNAFLCQTAPFVATYWMGIVMAKGNLLVKLKDALNKNRLLNPIADVFWFGTIIFLREFYLGDVLDVIYVPFMIICSIDLLERMKWVKAILYKIGTKSTNMWLIHSFFCYYFYAVVKIIVFLKWAIPCLVMLLILTYIASVGVDLFWEYISKMRIKIAKNILPLICKKDVS
jgi:hypothetical protein